MKTRIMTDSGECVASVKSERELEMMKAEVLEAPWLPKTLRWLEAVKDPTRFQLVYLLYRYDMLCVCDLANILNVSSSAVSQHLRKLKDMDLVQAFRVKQTMFYRIKSQTFKRFLSRLVDEEGRYARIKTGA